MKSKKLNVLFILSVINGHQNISHTAIRNVLAHETPYKFRVLAQLVDFHPNTVDPAEFLQQLCPKCFFLLVLSIGLCV